MPGSVWPGASKKRSSFFPSVGEGYAPDPLFGAKALGAANPVVFSEVERA
jgi:hypothetical protein